MAGLAVSRNGCRSVYTHHTGRKCKGKSYIQGHCRTTRRNCSKDHPVCTNSCHRHKSEAVSAVAMEVAMEEVEKVVEKEGGVTEEGGGDPSGALPVCQNTSMGMPPRGYQ